MPGPAEDLVGKTLGSGWVVAAPMTRSPSATGGTFSFGYRVTKGKQHAFLKAMDLSNALMAPDQLAALRTFTEMIEFEGDLLSICRDEGLSRIVRLIEEGFVETAAPGASALEAAASRVYFFVFELGDEDVRQKFGSANAATCAAKLRALHHIATAIQQLHGKSIAHQDIKPSNVLLFNGTEHKLADLGRASLLGRQGPVDSLPFPGDMFYMPPEYAYGFIPPEAIDRRFGLDAYLLGSLISFLFTLQGASALLKARLPESQKAPAFGWAADPAVSWNGTFQDVLPHLIRAHSEVCDYLADHVPDFSRFEIVQAFRELTDPDPSVRGHPKTRSMQGRGLGMDRYISLFDRLTLKAEVFERVAKQAKA